ncbi:DUF4230 domain-containing protein [Owenweeksia hongkongensis]|uniref:DUF4230 domain-containing protein n=1 Tax=Owenweeksia hongkongensis TaxID=253245 RepID=UPI003A91D21C
MSAFLKPYLIILISSLLFISCKEDKRGLVVGKIQKASELATTEFTVNKLVHGTKTKKIAWVFKLNEARFLAYSQAKIKTGIELGRLRKEDIEIDGDIISIMLPPVKVVNFSYPPESFYLDSLISDPNQFLNKISIEEQEHFFREAELDIRNNLKYIGIVETTQQNTRILLTRLLSSLGYNEIHINFKNDSLIVDEVNLETTL